VGTTLGYWIAVALGALIGATACAVARAFPGRPASYLGRGIAMVLAAEAATFVLRLAVDGDWTRRNSLPLNLCDVALVIAAFACWFPQWQIGVELTYFWGLAGTLQAVLTPDLSVSFPHMEFFQFVVGHLAIVIGAVYLVVGLRIEPRRGCVPRVFAITAAYTVIVGVVDWLTGSNYMYLSHAPAHSSLLSVLGPWPWYILSAGALAFVLLLILDAPFRYHARARSLR